MVETREGSVFLELGWQRYCYSFQEQILLLFAQFYLKVLCKANNDRCSKTSSKYTICDGLLELTNILIPAFIHIKVNVTEAGSGISILFTRLTFSNNGPKFAHLQAVLNLMQYL